MCNPLRTLAPSRGSDCGRGEGAPGFPGRPHERGSGAAARWWPSLSVIWSYGLAMVARQWIRCGTLAGQPQNAVLRAGDLWRLLRNCKPNFVLAAGYRVRAASCAHRGLPALFASVRRTRGHKRLSACAHGMPSNLSRPSRELLSSLAAKNFCCCCCKK